MKKTKTARAIHANRGIEAAYRKAIQSMVAKMARSVEWWLTSAMRKQPSSVQAIVESAQDANPFTYVKMAIAGLRSRWENVFRDGGQSVAEKYIYQLYKASDSAFRRALKDSGWTVDFKMTPAMRDAFSASLGENVGLIRSIPQQYLDQVEGIVSRGYARGRDLESISKELKTLYPKASRRAELIARDQCNKANAVVTRTRQMELGITEAIWLHSHGGKEPRPSHVAANGKRFNVVEGCLIEGEMIFPGEKINCFHGEMPIYCQDNELVRLWRSPFKGPMVHICVGADLLKGTFNHPILTSRGWVALGEINDSDKIVCMVDDGFGIIDDNKNKTIPTFEELFKSLSGVFYNGRRGRIGFNFYGDTPDGDVDEIIVKKDFLRDDIEASAFKNTDEFFFTKSDGGIYPICACGLNQVFCSCSPCGFNERFSVFGSGAGHPFNHGAATIAHDTMLNQNSPGCCGVTSRHAQLIDDCGGPYPGFVQIDDNRLKCFPVDSVIRSDSDSTEFFAEFVRVAANQSGRVFKFGPASYEFRSFHDKSVRDFSGHVYTLQSVSGYYSISNALVQAKNCRCTSRAILPI